MRVSFATAAVLSLAMFAAPRVTAGPALLFDPADGKILYAEDLDSQWHPASLTKIMTAYLTFEALRSGKLKLDQKIGCSQTAATQAPGNLGLPVGATITVDLALKALIVKSANDVAVMLAEAVSGSDVAFVADMNATARRLGMTRTTFVNPNGLPAYEQMTTARDLARLARAAINDYPEYAKYWSMADMRIGKKRLITHNGLLNSFDGADGMKTGFICDSGFNVVASATRDGHRLMAVVLGEPTGAGRTIRAASLLEHGFQQYGWKQLFNTASIDSTPLASDAKGITSMRQSVISWECGTGRKTRSIAARKASLKAAKANLAKGAAGSATASTDAAVVTPGKAAVKPQPITAGAAGAAKPKPATARVNATPPVAQAPASVPKQAVNSETPASPAPSVAPKRKPAETQWPEANAFAP